MADQSCDLHDAPEHFFDQVRWNEFVARAGDKRTALERISRKDPAGISYYRQMAAERPGPEGAKARAEGELIDYFLYGRHPDDSSEEPRAPAATGVGDAANGTVNTGQILSYFVRRFVQSIPGIEAELLRAAYSRPSLDSALRGPTSPLALAS